MIGGSRLALIGLVAGLLSVAVACGSSADRATPTPPDRSEPSHRSEPAVADDVERPFAAAEVRVNLGDLPDGWSTAEPDHVTCSEPILGALGSATSVSRSYETRGFTDGAGLHVGSDAFVYLDAADARDAWLGVSSQAYADCLVVEARRAADAHAVEHVVPEIGPSEIDGSVEGVSAIRELWPAAPGAEPRVVDRVWLLSGNALVALRLAAESAPFDPVLARRIISKIATRAEGAAVTRVSLQQSSPSQPPAESTAARARGALIGAADLPVTWVKAASADPAGSVCSNELLRELGAKPLVVYGDPYVPETDPAAGLVDSIVYMFSIEHEARWGLERLAGESYFECLAGAAGPLRSDAETSFRELADPGFGDRARIGQLVGGGGERVLASKIWIQQGTLIGGIGITLGDDQGDSELARALAAGMASRLAPRSSG